MITSKTSRWISALALGGCLALGAIGGAAAKTSKDKLQIGIVAVNLNSPTILRMKDAAEKDAKARGWEVSVFDGRGDQVATNNAAINFINRKFDAIINVASDNTQMSAVIKAANAANIPFVSTFSGDVPGITAEIGANSVVDGALAASELRNMINGQGRIVKINWNVLPALRDRDHGFKAALADAKNIKVTEIEVKVPGQVEDAYNQMTNLLAANKDIVGVWVGWDELGPPVVRAIEQAGMGGKIKVVGMDGIEPVYDLLRKGNSPYVLSVAYAKEPIGEKAVQVVADTIDGKKQPARVLYTRSCLVTRDTVPAANKDMDFKTCTPFSGEIVAK
jgi:ABC-type sugar transport system substrate-binding protein